MKRPWEDEDGGSLGGSEDAGGDARAPSLDSRSPIRVGDRLRGDDEEGALQAIFRGMTWAVPEPRCVDVVGWTGYDALQVG